MRVLFMGSPEFAVPSLKRLQASHHTIVAVVTLPDRPRGRGQRHQPTPVAQKAEALGLPVIKISSLKDEESCQALEELDFDAIVLVAFGLLVPASLLHRPALGCINLHPSLLPAYRGASPIHAPLLAGDTVTGVTTMYMDEGLDTGDVIEQKEVPIPPEANAGDLHDLLSREGADLLLHTLDLVEKGKAPRIPQDDAQASYAPKVYKESVPWDEPATTVLRKIRGLSPLPGVFTTWQERRMKPLRARIVSASTKAKPGTIVAVEEEGIIVACGEGAVLITHLQVAGRRPITGSEFIRGFHPQAGQTLS